MQRGSRFRGGATAAVVPLAVRLCTSERATASAALQLRSHSTARLRLRHNPDPPPPLWFKLRRQRLRPLQQ